VSVRVLSIHAGYACRHSGACCAAGWRIPVEAATRIALDDAVSARRLPDSAARVEASGSLAVLALAPDGACTAFEPARGGAPGRCAIHRVLGPEALPSACRHFPRVSLLDPRGVAVTLSHFCPTAASLLFDDGPLTVAEDPPGFVGVMEYEGLDARDALPPLLSPGMLMDLESYAAWEAHALDVLDDMCLPSAEAALAVLAGEVERLRTWTPRQGPLVDHVRAVTSVPRSGSVPHPGTDPDAGTQVRRVFDCIPPGLSHPPLPDDLPSLDETWVAARWTRWHRPVRRYLAARLHASWVAYQGRGLRSVLASLSAALHVVRAEAARAAGRAARPLDRALLIEAIRAADLLLVHVASRDALARAWSRAEDAPPI